MKAKAGNKNAGREYRAKLQSKIDKLQDGKGSL